MFKSFSNLPLIMLTRFFWFMAILTLIFIIVQIAGFNVINYIFLLVLIDLVLIEVNRHFDKHEIKHSMKNELLVKVYAIEKICSEIVKHLENSPTHSHVAAIVENKFEKHEVNFKESIDRLAKKAVDIENDMNRLKRTVGSALYGIDERIKVIEEIEGE